MADRYRTRKGKKQQPMQEAEPEPEPQQTPAEPAQEAAPATSWEDMIKDPAINQKLQETINNRTKNLREAMKDLAPALEVIGRQYGMDLTDMSKADFKALAKAVTEDNRYYEDKALEMGLDVETVRKLDSLESDKRRREAEDQKRQEDETLHRHYVDLQRQAAELQKDFPNFNLDAELNNPVFYRMTLPGGGLNVRQAFYAVHGDEVAAAKQAATARAVSTAISNSIRSGRQMPQENGTSAKASAGVTTKLYSQMSREERAAYKAKLQSGSRMY
jgi:hypothetical protein